MQHARPRGIRGVERLAQAHHLGVEASSLRGAALRHGQLHAV